MDRSPGDPAPTRDELLALGLLDGGAPDARDREALLQFLVARGASLDDLRRSRDLGRLVGHSVEQVLRPGPRLTRRELAWRTGVDDDLLVRLRQAGGLPDPGIDSATYTESDVVAVRAFERLALLLGEHVALQLMRVVGAALARVAEATLSAYARNVAAPLRAHDAGNAGNVGNVGNAGNVGNVGNAGIVATRAFTELAMTLPDLGRALDVLLRHHLDHVMQELAATASTDHPHSDVLAVSIGFVDLVGSTAWARSLPVEELAAALGRFAALANAVATRRGARVVKLIGDEAMFVASDPAVSCGAALELVDACAATRDLPPLRGGIATGAVVARDGDYHGEVVHLASRLVKEADPHRVVVDAATARRVGARDPDVAFHGLGPRWLRGFDEPAEVFGATRREARAVA